VPVTSEWGSDSVSVIVLPAGMEGQGLLQVARKWTATWMLAPAFWVRAEDVPAESEGPPEIPALVLGRGPFGGEDEVEVELFWKLGEHFRPRVRLIAIRMLQSPSDDLVTAHAIDLIDSYLDRALPTRLDRNIEQDPDSLATEFLRLNLIVDAAEVTGINAISVFKAAWQANIVASPEDRSTPFSPDAPPIHPRRFTHTEMTHIGESPARAERYYGWALAHVASVAGIWSGLNQSVYDLMPSRPTVAHSMCLVQRICVRGVVTDGLAIQLAADAMELTLNNSEEAGRQVQNALALHNIQTIPDSETYSRAKSMVDVTLNGFRDQGFGYRDVVDPGPYRRPKVSLGHRINLVFKLGGKATIKAPEFLVNLVLQRLSSSLTVEDGDAIVESASTWNPGFPTIDDSVFTVPSTPIMLRVGMKSSPQVWRDLRDMIFSSLDANPSHDVAEKLLAGSVSAQRMVFPSKSDVLPDPRGTWKHEALTRVDAPPFPEIGWMDSKSAKQTLDDLNSMYDAKVPQTHKIRKDLEEQQKEVSVETRELDRLGREASGIEAEASEAQEWLVEMQTDHPHLGRSRSIQTVEGDFPEAPEEIDAPEFNEDDEPVEEPIEQLGPEDPCSPAQDELSAIHVELKSSYRQLANSELRLRKVRRKANRLEMELEESELDLQEIQNAQQSLEDWVRARNGSFAWQLSDSLSLEREKAQSAKSRAEQWLENGHAQTIKLLLPIDERRRLWPRFGAQLAAIVALVVLSQYLRNVSVSGWTQYIPTPWPMIGFAVLIFIGLALESWLKYERAYASVAIGERWKQRENAGVKGLDSGQHALALIDVVRRILVPIPLYIALGFAIEVVRDLVPVVVQGYFPKGWVIWVVMVSLYLLTLLSVWISYYKFLSQLRFQIISVLYEANRQSNAYRYATIEDARLDSMHSLLPDYLEMLGKPINTPWSVDMSQIKEGDMRPEGGSLPASVGLAEATGADSRQWHDMENRSRKLLYRPGWITNAFRGMLERIAEFEGMNPRALTPDTVAADPGDSRRGQRRLVSEMSTNEVILAGSGRDLLLTLSEAIQKGVIRDIKPLVNPLRTNELAELDISTSRFKSDNPNQVPWNEFLEEALSEAAPFSMLTFSETGIAAQSFLVRESHALVPKDLSDVESTSKLRIIESDEGGHNTPLDMVIRIDRSDWLDPRDLLLFTGVEPPADNDSDRATLSNRAESSSHEKVIRHRDE